MKYTIMFFILITALIIILGHGLLWLSLVKFFGITSFKAKTVLAVILGILSVSFLVTMLLTYASDTWIVNALYTGSGIWLGAMLYIGMALVGVWTIYGLSLLLRFHAPVAVLTSLFLFCAILYSAYGTWNAQHPILKKMNVTIPNLPEAWKGKVVVQLSDIHLGPVQRQAFLRRVIKATNSVNPDAVFITGDLFDGAGKHLDQLAAPLKDLQTTKGAYFITGNHETYIGVERSLNAIKDLPITVLRDKHLAVDGLNIIGVDYPAPGEKKDLTEVLGLVAAHQPNIVLFHEPKGIDAFKAAGTNLFLSGHTHVGQLWPFGFITRSIFKGYDYGLHVEGSFTEYTSSGVGTWGPALRTGNRPEIDVFTLQ